MLATIFAFPEYTNGHGIAVNVVYAVVSKYSSSYELDEMTTFPGVTNPERFLFENQILRYSPDSSSSTGLE